MVKQPNRRWRIFVRGVTRIVSPRGGSEKRPDIKLGTWRDDAKALAGDWIAVGNDLRNAMASYEGEAQDDDE